MWREFGGHSFLPFTGDVYTWATKAAVPATRATSARHVQATSRRSSAVAEVAASARRLLTSLHTHAPARDREIEAEKARERSRLRFG